MPLDRERGLNYRPATRQPDRPRRNASGSPPATGVVEPRGGAADRRLRLVTPEPDARPGDSPPARAGGR
ncbi:MAG: hypothetical protein OXG35_09830, partial [Acidobacteria bacterium]|nr:hypothetical protein [Acidobacteriota bacterium]